MKIVIFDVPRLLIGLIGSFLENLEFVDLYLLDIEKRPKIRRLDSTFQKIIFLKSANNS
jgi:hypothetical protein